MFLTRKYILATVSAGALLAATVAVSIPLSSAGAGAAGTVINVDTTDDENNDDGDCSLREATESANTDTSVDDCEAGTGPDTVMIPGGTYTFAPEGDGDIAVTDDATFVGAGAATTIIDADGIDRVFSVFADDEDLVVEFDGLTITGGDVDGEGGGIAADSTTLTVRNSVVTGNEASDDGGGIDSDDSDSSLTLVNSTVSNNIAGDEGGGFRQDNSDTQVTVTDSTITGNDARLGGGIHIDNGSVVTITGTTISDNTSTNRRVQAESFQGFRGREQPGECFAGGGGYNQDSSGDGDGSSTSITNSTISGNTTDCEGGGLYLATDATLTNVTITDNGAPVGGNVFFASEDNRDVQFFRGGSVSGELVLANTIVAAPRTGEDCATPAAAPVSAGGNIDTDGTCNLDDASDQTVDDAMLGALAANGGSTQTHLPAAGSPAIDLALDANCTGDDQRDVTRPQDGDIDGTATCDVGAVEVASTPDAPTPPSVPDGDGDGGVDADTATPATPATPTVARPTFTG